MSKYSDHIGFEYRAARRFLLLGGDDYYPGGGMFDFVASYDSLEEAVSWAVKPTDKQAGEPYKWHFLEWWHIWDCQINAVVACCTTENSNFTAADRAPIMDEKPK